MCGCVDIDIGSHKASIALDVPEHMKEYADARERAGLSRQISADKCLIPELKYLWSLGISTNGCCCGHNKCYAYIGVFDKDIPHMLKLGYEVAPNHPDYPDRTDSFYPKSISFPKNIEW